MVHVREVLRVLAEKAHAAKTVDQALRRMGLIWTAAKTKLPQPPESATESATKSAIDSAPPPSDDEEAAGDTSQK